jgi:MFS family permease
LHPSSFGFHPFPSIFMTYINSYLARWWQLSVAARLYLVHAALLTGSLALYGTFFNFAIPALGFDLSFLGILQTTSIAVAAVFSLPLWWLVTRIGLRRALMISALLQAAGVLMAALWPQAALLLLGVALTGAAATMFQVSSPPFMMEYSDDATRDHLFSANTAVNIGFAGVVTFFAGDLKLWLAAWLHVGAESGLAYRATFAVAGLGLVLAVVPLLMITRRAPRPIGLAHAEPHAGIQSHGGASAPAHGDDEQASWIDSVPFLVPLARRLPPNIRRLVQHPMTVLPLLFSPLLISFGAAMLIVYLNLFFRQRFGINDIEVGRILAILGIATGVAALIGPAISTRIGKAPTIVLTQLLSIPFLLMLGFVPVLGIAVGAALVRGALFNMGSPLYDAFAMERTDEAARPIVIGLINGAYTVGYLVSPVISTWVQKNYGFSPLFIATAVFYGAAALVNYMLFVRRRAGAYAAYEPQLSDK